MLRDPTWSFFVASAHRAISRAVVIAAVTVLLTMMHASVNRASSQPAPKPEPTSDKGFVLADRLCRNCHLMEGAPNSSVPAGIITLRGIANRNNQTGQKIMDMLFQPHPPMPDMRLSIEEINSIILYLESLRTNNAVRPLIEPNKSILKPSYPQPS